MSFNEKKEQEDQQQLLINEEDFLEAEIVEDDESAPMGTLVSLPKDEIQETKEEPEDNGELSEEEANEVFGDSEGLEVSQRIITKQFVYEYIESAEYADKVELNKRENYNSANWPVADTHYALGTDKQCFIYVYETKNPTVLLIYNTPEYAEELKKDHPLVCESKVPRSNTPWYKLIMDDTYTEEQVKKIIDDCFAYAYVIKEEQEEPEEEIQDEVQEDVTPIDVGPIDDNTEEEVVEEEQPEEVIDETPQEEPIAEEEPIEEISEEDEEDVFGGVVEDETAEKIITKQFVYEYLEGCDYADKVKLNKRENYNSANWPVPDTHFACGDKEKFFVYVYETKKPTVLLIFNTPEYAEELKKDHPQIKRSKVPNNAKETWFNLVMDETYTEDQVKQILDDAFAHAYRVAEEEAAEEAAELAKQEEVIEEPVVEEEQEQEVTLKESLAAAATISHNTEQETIDKKFIYEYLDNKYGKDVELNTRENFTSTGLPLADTHYVAGKKKKCFVYVYETNGTTLLLINNTSDYEKQLKKEHKLVTKSSFPKSKDEWFSVIIDDSFSKTQVQKVLDDCFVFNGGTAKEEIVVEPEIKTYGNSAFEEKKATDEVKYDYQEAVDAQNKQIKEEQEIKPKKAPKKVNEDEIWGRVVFNKKEEPKKEPVKEEKPKTKKAASTTTPKTKVEEPKKETKAKAEPAKKEAKSSEKKPVEKKAEPKVAPKTEKSTKENKNIDKEKTTMADEEKIIQEGDNTKPHGKFVIRKTDKDNFVFKLISSNKRVVAIGAEAYASLQGAKGGIESIRKNAATAPIQDSTLQKVVELKFPKWEIYTDKKGEFRLRLYAANGNIVATTNDGYNQKTGAKSGIDAVARACIGSEIVRNDNPRAY